MISVEDTHRPHYDHQPSSPRIYFKKAKLTWCKDYKAYHLSSKLKALPFYFLVAEVPFLLVIQQLPPHWGKQSHVSVTHEYIGQNVYSTNMFRMHLRIHNQAQVTQWVIHMVKWVLTEFVGLPCFKSLNRLLGRTIDKWSIFSLNNGLAIFCFP